MNEEKEFPETVEDAETPETPTVPEAEHSELVEIVGIRFKEAGKTYYFAPNGITVKLGDFVIAETARGIEMGKVTIANRTVPMTETVAPLRPVVRIATPADITHQEENKKTEQRAAEVCREKIRRHKLEMSLVSVEYTFDNSKLLFYFTAENRVDFRELVKDLASVFKTRIELRQIGIRDEAKMMGGFGVCGRPFCCSTFLSDFVQVSIKMAKEQNFSLNSAKISGACGRLMCCLRYEHEVYEEALQSTPAVGSQVSTPNGIGIVVETRPLAGTVKVRLEEKNEAPRSYPCSEIRVLRGKGGRPVEQKPEEETVEEAAPEAEETSVTVSTEEKVPAEQQKREERGRDRRHNDRRRDQNRPRSKNAPTPATAEESTPATEEGGEEERPSTRHGHSRPHRGGRGRRHGGRGGHRGNGGNGNSSPSENA